MEIFYSILGLIALYSTIHFIVLSFTKSWNDRGEYEKVVSIAGICFITLLFIGVISE
jgi:hypothetical protein